MAHAFDSAFKPRINPNFDDQSGSGSQTKSHKGVLSKFLSTGHLTVHVDNPTVFLRPQAPSALPGDAGPPQDDCVLSGHVTLSLPKAHEVKKIVVGVRGYCDIGFPDHPRETKTVLNSNLEIDLHKVLEKGDHQFEWSFIIPASTAPYERSPFGRTYHKVVATAKGAGFIGDLDAGTYWFPVCNPSGNDYAGLSLDVHLEQHSAHLGPYLISVTSSLFTVSGLLSFHMSLPSVADGVTIHDICAYVTQTFRLKDLKSHQFGDHGPPPQKKRLFRIDGGFHPPGVQGRPGFASAAPSRSRSRVTSTTRLDNIHESHPLPNPTPESTDGQPTQRDEQIDWSMDSISTALSTSGFHRRGSSTPNSVPESRATSPERLGRITESQSVPTSRGKSRGRDRGKKSVNVTDLNTPLAKLETGQAWSVRHIARLPNDDAIRPSTHSGTETPIHVSHAIQVEVIYSIDSENEHTPDSKDQSIHKKMLSISKPVHIVSCCCMLESMVLPPYSEGDPHSEMFETSYQSAAHRFCVCAMSTQSLLRTQDPTTGEVRQGDLPQGTGAIKTEDSISPHLPFTSALHGQPHPSPPLRSNSLDDAVPSTSNS